MKIKFWGVRGSVPTPLSPEQLHSKINAVVQRIQESDIKDNNARQKFIATLPNWLFDLVGGNTPCVELTSKKNDTIIVDCGTGMRSCGKVFATKKNKTYHIFLSHFHWDHIQGLPFFDPAYDSSSKLNFYSSFEKMEDFLKAQMDQPYFPVQIDSAFTKQINYIHYNPGVSYSVVDGVSVMSKLMSHPGGTYAYSFIEDGHKFIYATDVELQQVNFEKTPENTIFFENADVLLFDAQYTVEEALMKEHWGHSAFCSAIDFAILWNIDKLYLYHHEPTYNDKKLYEILELARWYANYASKGKLEVDLAIENLEIEI